jgi:methionine-rich copper-binding protein CopC
MKTVIHNLVKLIPCLVFVIGIFSAVNVLAHNTLVSTLPVDKAVLHAAPTEIRLVFSDATYLVSLSVMNAEGIDVLQAFEPAPEGANSFTVDLPASLEQGLYHVSWAVVGDDTHRVPGEFSFSVNAEVE